MNTKSLPVNSCPYRDHQDGRLQAPTPDDSICTSYRSRQQLERALDKFFEMLERDYLVAVIGQRCDLERVSRHIDGTESVSDRIDTWIPLNTYSALPSEALNLQLESFFSTAKAQNKQPVILMEATEHINCWIQNTPQGALISEWVRWAKCCEASLLVLFHHPQVQFSRATSLLQPFPWLIIKGEYWLNQNYVPICPMATAQHRYCQRAVLKNIDRIFKHRDVNQEIFSRIARMLHFYFGPTRVESVTITLDDSDNCTQPCQCDGVTKELFPLNFTGHPSASIVVHWLDGNCADSDDLRVIRDTIGIISQRYNSWVESMRVHRLRNVVNQVARACECHVLGMRRDGQLSLMLGSSMLGTTDDAVIKAIPHGWLQDVHDTFLSGEPLSGHELTVMPSDETEPIIFWAEGHPVSTTFEGLVGLIILRDVTKWKCFERDLMQRQKLDTVRLMSGGITHDLNNVLSAIMGYSSYLSMRLLPEDPLRDDLAMIERSTGKAADLVQQLLGYSRKTKKPTGMILPNNVCEEVAQLIKPSLNGSKYLRLEFDPEPLPAIGDANQIQQAIMNLCLNAKDAISPGGSVTIKTESKMITGNEPGLKSCTPGKYTVITVSDDGTGIPRDIRAKIFEPFFTTKSSGKGTGLGLTMVKMIVENHGGKMIVRSRKNQGTSISLVLRAMTKPVEDVPPIQLTLPHGKEGVLLVDDEPSIVEMGARILGDKGYRVFTASTISEAEKVLSKNLYDIDLALVDIVFPEKDGFQCSSILKELSPNLKVVMFSGYTQNDGTIPSAQISGYPFVQKPFRASDLLDTVRKTLDDIPTYPTAEDIFLNGS